MTRGVVYDTTCHQFGGSYRRWWERRLVGFIATAMKRWTTGSVYRNHIGDGGLGRVEAAYRPERYARLKALRPSGTGRRLPP